MRKPPMRSLKSSQPGSHSISRASAREQGFRTFSRQIAAIMRQSHINGISSVRAQASALASQIRRFAATHRLRGKNLLVKKEAALSGKAGRYPKDLQDEKCLETFTNGRHVCVFLRSTPTHCEYYCYETKEKPVG